MSPARCATAVARLLAPAALFFAFASCADDPPVSLGKPEVKLRIAAEIVGAALVDRTVDIRATYSSGGQRVTLVSTPSSVTVTVGESVEQAVTINIGPCLADARREPAGAPGCRFTIELVLRNTAGDVLASDARDIPSALPGQSVTIPAFVLTPPTITVDPATLDFTGTITLAPPAARTATITLDRPTAPIGTLTAAITYGSGQGWLRADVNQTARTIAIGPSTTALAAGNYAATVTVSSSTEGIRPQTVQVTYRVLQPPQVLALTGQGSGNGTVTSAPAGIDCAITAGSVVGLCQTSYPFGTTVTLSASPAIGHVFLGWSGACTGTGTCVVVLDQARAVRARFEAPQTLALTLKGAGSTGSVFSTPAGIDCRIINGVMSGPCTATFTYGTVVNLTATPNPQGDVFVGWDGACTGTTGCSVTLDRRVDVGATFAPPPRLTVTLPGTGSGVVTSNPFGITCNGTANGSNGTCAALFPFRSQVTLTAAPNGVDLFTGWGGDCSGTASTCTVAMDQPRNVTATFTVKPETLTVLGGGTGVGLITSIPAGISCTVTDGVTSGVCRTTFPNGSLVTLSATSATNDVLTAWSDPGCVAPFPCSILITSRTDIRATFQIGARLGLIPTSVNFSAAVGGVIPPPQFIQIVNLGQFPLFGPVADTAIVYGPTTSVKWLAVSQQTTTIALNVLTALLPVGTHTATVKVTSQNGGTVLLPVTIGVGNPSLLLSPAFVTVVAPFGSTTVTPAVITISNGGFGQLADLGAITQGTIVFSPSAFPLTVGIAPGTLTLTPATTSVAIGTYTATITLNSVNGGSRVVVLTFRVQ